MKISYYFIICLVGLLLGNNLTIYSQIRTEDYLIERWTTNNGLPQNSVRKIVQSDDGYIWIGTYGGLARFNGVNFTFFGINNSEETNYNRIQNIISCGKDSILIENSEGSFNLLTRGQFRSVNKTEELLRNVINNYNMSTGTEASILLTNKGFKSFKKNEIKSFLLKLGDKEINYSRIFYISNHGNLYSQAQNGSIIAFNNGNIFEYYLKSGKLNNDNIFEDVNENIWIGGIQNLSVYQKNGEIIAFSKKEGFPDGKIMSFCEDAEGNIWMGSDKGNLIVYSKGKFFKLQNVTRSGKINSIMIDQEQSIWIGTDLELLRLKKRKIHYISKESGLNAEIILSINQDRNGVIWIGTSGNTMYKYINGKASPFLKSSLTENVWSVFIDNQGDLWFGNTKGEVTSIKNGVYKTITKKEGKWGDHIRVIYQDRKNNLWVGSSGGLSLLSSGKIKTFTKLDGLCHNFVTALLEDKNGTLWIGTYGGGICSYSEGKFKIYSSKDGLSNNIIRCIFEDKKGYLWFGTYGGGLNRFIDGKFVAISSKDGLSDIINNIIEDSKGNLWMSSNRGIFFVRRNDLYNFVEGKLNFVSSVVYDDKEGMLINETNGGFQPSICKTNNNEIWYPTMRGIAVVDLKNFGTFKQGVNKYKPPIVIEKFVVDDKIENIDEEPEIPPESMNYSFYFTALSFYDPLKNKFKYKLDGFENDWINSGDRRSAFYTHLPPGEYIFRVIGCNNDGVWNFDGASLKIKVRSAFYQTLWFRLFSVLSVIVLVYLFSRSRTRQLRLELSTQIKHQKELEDKQRYIEELIEERNKQLVITKKHLEIEKEERKKTEENLMILRKEIEDDFSFQGMISKNPKMQQIFSILPVIAKSDSTILIEGQTGTGKELIAKAIQKLSNRSNKPYIIINCATLPSSLIETELFGHSKGAYTDAKNENKGRILSANGGTIFFDEIGEIPIGLQSKFLRLIENYEIEPIGTNQHINVDIRIIAATNRNLIQMVEKGEFRDDLYYRLRTVPVNLPPLNERKEDIPYLINHFIKNNNAKMNKKIDGITHETMQQLYKYNYPGNIRQLEKIIEFASLICDTDQIEINNLPEEIFLADSEKNGNFLEKAKLYEKKTESEERNQIITLLNKHKGNKTLVAKELKINYSTLYRKMKKFDI